MAHCWYLATEGWVALPPSKLPFTLHEDSNHQWVLFCRGTYLINGEPVALGIRVLRDRDEVRFQGDRFFFAAESAAEVQPYQGAPASCPRCRQGLATGALSVKCPGCGVVYHQSEELPCYTYGPCLCGTATALGNYPWTPEELG